MLSEMTIKDFIADLASSSPAPGGGGAAALAGAMGAALVSMVAELTLGKKGYEDVQAEVKEMGQEAQKLAQELMHYMDVDAEVFNRLMAAFKMPKATEEEKAIRAEALQKAYKEAADVPMQVAAKCLRVLRLCPEMARKGNRNAVSDVGVAAHAAWCGLKSALLNVQINMGSIKDSNYVVEARAKIDELTREGESIYVKIIPEVESLI